MFLDKLGLVLSVQTSKAKIIKDKPSSIFMFGCIITLLQVVIVNSFSIRAILCSLLTKSSFYFVHMLTRNENDSK